MAKPIFYDPTGKRRKWSSRSLILFVTIFFGAVSVIAMSVLSVSVPRALPVAQERNQRVPLRAQLTSIGHGVKRFGNVISSWLPAPRRGASTVNQFVVGFYAPWDPDSRASLVRHVNEIDWLVPVAANIVGPKHTLTFQPDTKINVIIQNATHQPQLLPLVQNVFNEVWDHENTAALLRDKKARAHFVDQMVDLVAQQKGKGIVYDFEELPAAALPDYITLLKETRARFAPQGWLVTVTTPLDDPDWPLAAQTECASPKTRDRDKNSSIRSGAVV